jgi:hypothetical protein
MRQRRDRKALAVGLILGLSLLFLASGALADDSGGEMTRISVSSTGQEADARSPTASLRSAISDDGSLVAFDSIASDLVEQDTNGVADIFIHAAGSKTTTLVSVASSGVQGNRDSYAPAMSYRST